MADGSSLNRLDAETFTEFHGNGGWLVEDQADHDKAKQNCSRGNVKPVPVMLSGTGVMDHLAASCVEISEKEFNTPKRKRESLSGMLNWMRTIAKNPFDPVAQPLPSKLKEYEAGQNFFVQMLRARDVLSIRKHAEPNSGSNSKKVKMHPTMYEDPVSLGHQGTVKLRCSERKPVPVKPRCTCCNSHSGDGNKLHGSVKPDVVIPNKKSTAKPYATKKKKSTAKTDVTNKNKSKPSWDGPREKVVSVGRCFQAEVPQWTGVVYESDSKWLGTQVWPVKENSKPTAETDLVGKGRQGKCSCTDQGSVDCLRFHISANRMKLKLELGSAFYHWGFDQMGEEVPLRWTADEEKRFKDAMRLKIPSQDKSFWNNPSIYVPGRTRKDMLRYYFNVYLIQLRSYQNRMTPKNVDSDDDEVQFESFGECSENKECFDFE